MRSSRTLLVAAVLALAGCDPVPVDGVPCTRWETASTVRVEHVDELDLLLVLGGSRDRNDAFMAELPDLLGSLSTGDLDGDGSLDVDGARSIHVAVITGDLGAGGHAVPGCAGEGDGGALRTEGDTSVPGCAATYPPFQALERGGRSAADVAADLTCLVPAGDGCAIEQPLEATLRALAPESIAHAGFLRERSALVVVIVSDRDDCSAADPRLFDPDDAALGALSLRCGLHPELLHPLERYVAALTAVPQPPRHIHFAIVAGAPPGVLPALGESQVYDSILARLEVRVDPEMPSRLVPACTDGIGPADPARRLVTLGRDLQALGTSTMVRSICEDADAAITRIASEITDRFGNGCVPRSLSAPSPREPAECTFTEVLRPGERCAEHPGRSHLHSVLYAGEQREECWLRALTREQAIAGEPGIYVETAGDPLPGSNLLALCGESGTRIELVGGKVANPTCACTAPSRSVPTAAPATDASMSGAASPHPRAGASLPVPFHPSTPISANVTRASRHV